MEQNNNIVGKEEINNWGEEERKLYIAEWLKTQKEFTDIAVTDKASLFYHVAPMKYINFIERFDRYQHQPLSPQSDVGVEDVLNKHWKHSTIWDAGDGHSIVDCPRCCYEKNVIAAMQEYASLSLGEKDKIIDKYAISARSIAVWLKDFCNEDLPYDEMISDAARKASKELSTKTAEVEELKGVVVELINWAKPEAVGRWNFEAVIEKAELKLNKLNAVQGDEQNNNL